MADKIKDIDDLFGMFHDFEITRLKLENKTLTMEILLPWSQMWNIEDYKLTFKFCDCDTLNCTYFKRTGTELVPWEKGVCYPTEEIKTDNIETIEKIELDIQSHVFTQPNHFKLYCISSTSHGNKIGQIDFAYIYLNVTDYQIYDHDGKEITLHKMKEWGTQWWDGIKKMWDDQDKVKKTTR